MKRIIIFVIILLATAGEMKLTAQNYANQSSGSSAYDSGKKAGKYAVPVAGLTVLVIFVFRWLLSSNNNRPVTPPRQAMGGRIPQGDPSLRGGQNTFASNPARLQLSAGSWLAAHPQIVILTLCVALPGLILLFVKAVPGIVLIAAAAIFLSKSIKRAKQKFFMGDVCPGIVLSAQQNLVAVFTDLKTGNLSRPAVKIFKQPLNRMTIEPAYDGMRVAAAALYFGNVRQAAWQDFSPEVINCVVNDTAEIARVLGSIQEYEWQSLDNCLTHIPVANPGLYRIWEVDSSAPVDSNFAPAKPWFKTTPGIVGLSILGAFVVLLFGLPILVSLSRSMNHRNASAFHPAPPPAATTMNSPMPGEPAKSGPFTVGGKVEANWAGGWIPGKITEIHPGGFTMMVQLEDSRWPNPIVLSTNQLRAK